MFPFDDVIMILALGFVCSFVCIEGALKGALLNSVILIKQTIFSKTLTEDTLQLAREGDVWAVLREIGVY